MSDEPKETEITFVVNAPVTVRATCSLNDEGQAVIETVHGASATITGPGDCRDHMDRYEITDLDERVAERLEAGNE